MFGTRILILLLAAATVLPCHGCSAFPGVSEQTATRRYTANTFDTSPALIDNNQKVVVESSVAKLAPDGDEFGSSLDLTNWRKAAGDYVEKDGRVIAQSGTGGADILERQIAYEDADVAVQWSNTYPATRTYQALVGFYLGKDSKNNVGILYFARKIGTPKYNFDVGKRINGTYTLLHWTKSAGAQTSIKFRIRRRKTDNHFWVYYDIGSGWVLTWSGVVGHPGYLDTSHSLKPQVFASRGSNSDNWKPEADRYYQVTAVIPVQRFWNDSPEIHVIASKKVKWAFDAGEGKAWKLTGVSAMGSQPGTSSIRFKVGLSDSPERDTATWYDEGKWKTISEINAAAENGEFDRYKYIFVSTQFNSDGKDQPALTSFSIHGCTVH